jgi:hypothetical protein
MAEEKARLKSMAEYTTKMNGMSPGSSVRSLHNEERAPGTMDGGRVFQPTAEFRRQEENWKKTTKWSRVGSGLRCEARALKMKANPATQEVAFLCAAQRRLAASEMSLRPSGERVLFLPLFGLVVWAANSV